MVIFIILSTLFTWFLFCDCTVMLSAVFAGLLMELDLLSPLAPLSMSVLSLLLIYCHCSFYTYAAGVLN